MNLTLPEQIYLCTYAFKKKKFPSTLLQHRGQRMRAAALAQLVIEGRAQSDGKHIRRTDQVPPNNAFLVSVWEELSGPGAKQLMAMVHNTGHTAEKPVSEQLVRAGIIERKTGRSFNPLSGSKFVLRRPEEASAVQDILYERIMSDSDPASLPISEVALPVITLESDATMGIVLDRSERRARRHTLAAFAERFDAEIPGLRSALASSVLSNRAVGGGWG